MSAKTLHCPPHWLQFGYSNRFEERVEFGRGLATHRGQHMAVGVERDRNLGVPEPFLHHLWVDALGACPRNGLGAGL